MKTIELTKEDFSKTLIVIDKIFEIKSIYPIGCEITSIGGAKTKVSEIKDEVLKKINQ